MAKKRLLKKLRTKRGKAKRPILRKLVKAAVVYKFWLPIAVVTLLTKGKK